MRGMDKMKLKRYTASLANRINKIDNDCEMIVKTDKIVINGNKYDFDDLKDADILTNGDVLIKFKSVKYLFKEDGQVIIN